MIDPLRIILLSPYLPANDTVGCARKIYDFIRIARQRGHVIFLFAFCSEADKQRIAEIKPYCAYIHLEYFKNYGRFPLNAAAFTGKIKSLCKENAIDILQSENSFMLRYTPTGKTIPSVLVEHEFLPASFYQRSKFENNPARKVILWGRAFKKLLECRNWYKRVDKIIVFSSSDRYFLQKLYNIPQVEVIPLGIDLNAYTLQNKQDKCYDLIFVGNFSHQPNLDAVLFFYKKILPLIKDRKPDIFVLLAGANPPQSIKRLAIADKNITVTGYVRDLSDYYYKSKVCIAPLRYGTGLSYKLLEALAYGMPIVATSAGARGLEAQGCIEIADKPREFAGKVIGLLNDSNKRQYLVNNSRQIAEHFYNWDTLLDKYEDVYTGLLS